MVAAPSSPGESRETTLEAMIKSKGVCTLDDLDGEDTKPQLELQAHHNLVVIVEMCQAQRPSKLGSLKGSHEKYEEELSRLESTVGTLAGAGSVEVIKWEAGMPAIPGAMSSSRESPPPAASGGRRSRPQSAAGRPQSAASRPASANPAASQNAQLRAYMGLGAQAERTQPRIGAFEVCYKLVNTQSGQQYGPVEVFSKLGSGHWPGAANILLGRVQDQLQDFLQRDMGHGMMFQHAQALAKEAKEQQGRPKTVLQQAENLPDPDPPPQEAAGA